MRFLQPKIFMQKIHVEWTKASRGAPLAAVRNDVPEAFEFSSKEPFLDNELCFGQFVSFYEHDLFAKPHIRTTHFCEIENLHSYGVSFEVSQEALIVRRSFNRLAYPSKKPKPVFTLTVGQWGRILSNARLVHDQGWSYSKTVINIGFFQAFNSAVFRLTNPNYIHDRMRVLR